MTKEIGKNNLFNTIKTKERMKSKTKWRQPENPLKQKNIKGKSICANCTPASDPTSSGNQTPILFLSPLFLYMLGLINTLVLLEIIAKMLVQN